MPANSIAYRFRAAWRLWRTGRRLRAEITPHLRPGVYIRTGYKGVVWRHWRSSVPDLVRETKAPPKAWKTVRARWKRWLRNTLVKGPPFFVVWPRKGRAPAVSQISLVVRGAFGDSFILLDEERSEVVRIAAEPQFSPSYADLRERFSRHIPCPGFDVAGGGRVLTEEYVSGVLATSLELGRQYEAVAALVRAFASLVAAEGSGSSESSVAELLDTVERAELPRSLRQALPTAWMVQESRRWPLVVSHGDAHVKNVVITTRGAVLIDIDPHFLGRRPFWFDAMSLVVSVHPVLRARLLGDPLTRTPLDELWLSGTGSRARRVTDEGLLAAATALRAHVLAKTGPSGDVDVATFEERAHAVWARARAPIRSL